MALLLGIDTGGTYTDAVLFDDSVGIIAKAKALTTRHDLAIGISGAVDRVLTQSGKAPALIELVSISTTLATNALVEGQHRRRRVSRPHNSARQRRQESVGGLPKRKERTRRGSTSHSSTLH